MLSKSQNKRVLEAYNEAIKNPCYHKHGCVISCSERIIGRGFNNPRTTSSDKVLDKCMTCHAEAAAIREVVKRYKWEAPHAKGASQCKLSCWTKMHNLRIKDWSYWQHEKV